MNSKYKAIVGVLGMTAAVLGAQVASAGSWGTFVNNGTLGSCATPSGFIDDNGDSNLDNYSLWMQHTSGHNSQIRGQATKTDGSLFCTSGFFSDGQSVDVECGLPVNQYRCQTNQLN